MNMDQDGRIRIPNTDFKNKERYVALAFTVADGGVILKECLSGKIFPLGQEASIDEVIINLGTEIQTALMKLIKDSKVGAEFTLHVQIRESINSLMAGTPFAFAQPAMSGQYHSSYWQGMMDNMAYICGIDDSTMRRYKPDQQGFCNLQEDIEKNKINVNKSTVGHQNPFGPTFPRPSSPNKPSDSEVSETKDADGKVKLG